MKNLIIGILVAIIGSIFAFYLNSKQADIRYSLSEKIPVRFLKENSQESIQQLTIKNNGKNEAKKIKIDIKKQITDYDIFPYSKADTVEKFPSKDSLEIIYSALPPEGNIKIIIKTIGDEVDEHDLSVAHADGIGKPALTKEISYSDFIFPIAGVTYFIFLGFQILKTYWETKSKYGFEGLLKRGKPFYIGEGWWNTLRKNALERKIESSAFSYHIERSNNYLTLASNKPDYLNEDEWIKLIHKATDALAKQFATEIARCLNEKNILEFLKIMKPEHMPEKEWKEIQEILNDKYFYLKQRHSVWVEILNQIQETKPENINTDLWIKYKQDLLKKYKNQISAKMEFTREPIKYLEKQDLSCLAKDDIEFLQERAYKIELNNISAIFLRPESAKKFVEAEKPLWLKDEDYEIIKKKALIVIDTERIQQENMANQSNLSREIAKTCELKNKIESQLRIVHDVLNDPSAADRIEEYNNAFAPGNFMNLKELSLLNKHKKILL